jgi:hypothetical protein
MDDATMSHETGKVNGHGIEVYTLSEIWQARKAVSDVSAVRSRLWTLGEKVRGRTMFFGR